MKTNSILATAAGLTVACLLSGCAREYSKETISPPAQMPSDQKFQYNIQGSANRPQSYQRPSTTNNLSTATFSVTAVGNPAHYDWAFATNVGAFGIEGTNPPLSYQWSFTNGDAVLQQSDFGASYGTNGNYYWYGATNSNEWGNSLTVQAAGGSNAPLYYQWYKNTNSP